MVNKTPILSFVIPVYNVEKYLYSCLNSIYNQNINKDLFEVIAVDDCGTDKSLDILLEYERQKSNFILLRHEKNKGLGAARNTGLKHVKGKYVWFVDSDDMLSENVTEKILQILSSEDLDLLMFNINTIDDKGERKKFYATYSETTPIIDGKTFLSDKKVAHWQKPVTAWSRIQKVSFMKKNNLNYPEGIFYEDEELHLKELFLCKRMRYISDVCYLYRVNFNSIMRSGITVKKFIDKIKVYKSCLILLKDYQKKYPHIVKNIYPTYLSVLYQHEKLYFEMSTQDRENIRKNLKNIQLNVIFHFTHNIFKYMLYKYPDVYEKFLFLMR